MHKEGVVCAGLGGGREVRRWQHALSPHESLDKSNVAPLPHPQLTALQLHHQQPTTYHKPTTGHPPCLPCGRRACTTATSITNPPPIGITPPTPIHTTWPPTLLAILSVATLL